MSELLVIDKIVKTSRQEREKNEIVESGITGVEQGILNSDFVKTYITQLVDVLIQEKILVEVDALQELYAFNGTVANPILNAIEKLYQIYELSRNLDDFTDRIHISELNRYFMNDYEIQRVYFYLARIRCNCVI